VDVYDGGFKDYCEAKERARRASAAPPRKERRPANPPEAKPKVAGGATFREHKAGARELERKARRAKELEAQVARHEAELAQIRGQLREAGAAGWEQIHAWANKERKMSAELDQMLAEWMKLSEAVK
jgi:hypothetical protein